MQQQITKTRTLLDKFGNEVMAMAHEIRRLQRIEEKCRIFVNEATHAIYCPAQYRKLQHCVCGYAEARGELDKPPLEYQS